MIHVDPKDVPEITPWQVEAALRGMKNGTTTGNYYINTDTFKAGEDKISNTIAMLYAKCLSEIRISTDGEIRKTSIITDCYYLVSHMYKVLTKELMKRLEKPLDEIQLRGKLDSEADTQRQTTYTSGTDLALRTGDRRCVHRTREGNLHQQLDDCAHTQRN